MDHGNASLPPWVGRLRDGEELNRRLDLTWLRPEQQEPLREEWLGIWNQVPFEDEFHRLCRDRLARCIPVAQGLVRRRRLQLTESRLALIHDPEEPEVVFVSLSHALPSMLWIRAGNTPDKLLDSLGPYLVEGALALVELPCDSRIVKPLGVDDREVIANAVDSLELWMDDATWASAHDDDPWPDRDEPLGMFEQAALLRDAGKEHPDRLPSQSWRSLWSKGVMRVEQHPFGMWVFELRYAPASDGKVIEYVGELTGSRLPEDLPVDLAASLLRGACLGPAFLEDLRARGERIIDQAALSCALAPGEMECHETLRALALEHRGDLQLLGDLADVAARYGHESLLFELAALTEGTELGDELRRFVAPSQAEPDQPAADDDGEVMP